MSKEEENKSAFTSFQVGEKRKGRDLARSVSDYDNMQMLRSGSAAQPDLKRQQQASPAQVAGFSVAQIAGSAAQEMRSSLQEQAQNVLGQAAAQVNINAPDNQGGPSRGGQIPSAPPVVSEAQLQGIRGQLVTTDMSKIPEYFKPIIPKQFVVSKKNRTFQAENPFSVGQTTRYFTVKLQFYVSNKKKHNNQQHPVQFEVPDGTKQLIPERFDNLFQPKRVMWDDISNLQLRGPMFEVNTVINQILSSLDAQYVAIRMIHEGDQLVFKSVPKQLQPSSLSSVVFGEGGVSMEQLAEWDTVADKMFIAALKLMNQLEAVQGEYLTKLGLTLKDVWEKNLTLTYAELKPDILKYNNQPYMASTSWYYSRFYINVIENSKLIVKPVSVRTNSSVPEVVTNYSDILLPSFYQIKYKETARTRYMQQFRDATAEQIGSRSKVMLNRIIGLEPESRSLLRFKLLEDYEVAEKRWSSKRTDASKKKEMRNFFNRTQYDKVKTRLNKEVDDLQAKLSGSDFYRAFMNYPEWPSAKVSLFPFVQDINLMFIGFHDNVSLGTGMVNSNMSGLQLNYSIVSKFVWKRGLMTPILDRVQFTRNLKSKYYLDEVLKQSPLVSVRNWSWHDRSIGLILRKKKRITLKAVLDQVDTNWNYNILTYPYIQNSLYWFKLFELNSMNVRRIIALSIWNAFENGFTTQAQFQQNVWLQPYRDTMQTRQQLVWEQGGAVTMDMWHAAYDNLAEGAVRKPLRKRFKTLFGSMKRQMKISSMLEMQHLNTEAAEAFKNSINSTKTIVIAFFYCGIIGGTPSYLTRDYSTRGMTGANIAASEYFRTVASGQTFDVQPSVLYANFRTSFLSNFAARPITIGIQEDRIQRIPLASLAASDTDEDIRAVEDLIQFCTSYYPGVHTLLGNKKDGRSLMDMVGQGNPRARGLTLILMLMLAAFMEWFETGLLMLQQYNSGYFKNISDKSFGIAVHAWFEWVKEIAEMFRADLSAVGFNSSQETNNRVSDLLGIFSMEAGYISKSLVRPSRRDRVSSKVSKDPREWQLFSELFSMFPEYVVADAPAQQTERKDLKSASRGVYVNMDEQRVKFATQESAGTILKDIGKISRLAYKQNMGTNRKSGRRIVAPITKEELAQLQQERGSGFLKEH